MGFVDDFFGGCDVGVEGYGDIFDFKLGFVVVFGFLWLYYVDVDGDWEVQLGLFFGCFVVFVVLVQVIQVLLDLLVDEGEVLVGMLGI